MSGENRDPRVDVEIGRTLEGVRKSRGLTLWQVEQETRIRSRYLRDLERENFDVLPAVYVLGSLKTYADFLGLDGAALSRQLKASLVEPADPNVPEQLAALGKARDEGDQYEAAPVPAVGFDQLFLGMGVILISILAVMTIVAAVARGDESPISQIKQPSTPESPSEITLAGNVEDGDGVQRAGDGEPAEDEDEDEDKPDKPEAPKDDRDGEESKDEGEGDAQDAPQSASPFGDADFVPIPSSSSPTSLASASASPTSASPTSASPTSASPTSASPTSDGPTSDGPTPAGSTAASPSPTIAEPDGSRASTAPTATAPTATAPASTGTSPEPARDAPAAASPALAPAGGGGGGSPRAGGGGGGQTAPAGEADSDLSFAEANRKVVEALVDNVGIAR